LSKLEAQGTKLFGKFPKKRDALPEEYERAFSVYYKNNRKGATLVTSFSSRLESWMHRQAAGCIVKKDQKVLEIGAGTLNHVPYESQYSTYDIVEPCKNFYQDSVLIKNLNRIYSDVLEIDEQDKYDKIISIATFEHVLNLPQLVAKIGVLLARGGKLCFSIPNEGTLLWRWGYTLTTGIEFKIKYGLKYSIIMNYEHVNTAHEIKEIAEYFFQNVKIKNFGLNPTLAFYQYYECDEPFPTRCKHHA
jgi:SAM-dependent methyltransferase